MTQTTLKILALILMTIDHIGGCLPNMPIFLRYAGRLSSPLFFFCAAESVAHTSDIRRYLKRLWSASLFMVIFESAVKGFFHIYFNLEISFSNNIFLTIFHGALIASIIKCTENDSGKRKKYLLCYVCCQLALAVAESVLSYIDPFGRIGLQINLVPILSDWDNILFTALGSLWRIEGPVILILQIVIFYICRNDKKKLALWYSAYSVLYFIIFVPQLGIKAANVLRASGLSSDAVNILTMPIQMLGISTMPFESANGFVDSMLRINYQWMMIFSLPFMLLYNGKRGKNIKKLFYIYYPLHLLILNVISSKWGA